MIVTHMFDYGVLTLAFNVNKGQAVYISTEGECGILLLEKQ